MKFVIVLAITYWSLITCDISLAKNNARLVSAGIFLDGQELFSTKFVASDGRNSPDENWINFVTVQPFLKPTEHFDQSLLKRDSSGGFVLSSGEKGPPTGKLQISAFGVGIVWVKEIRLKKTIRVGHRGWVFDKQSLLSDSKAVRLVSRSSAYQIKYPKTSWTQVKTAHQKPTKRDQVTRNPKQHRVMIRHRSKPVLSGSFTTQKTDPDQIWQDLKSSLDSGKLEFTSLSNVEDGKNGFKIGTDRKWTLTHQSLSIYKIGIREHRRTSLSLSIYLPGVGLRHFKSDIVLSEQGSGKYGLESFEMQDDWKIDRSAVLNLKNEGKRLDVLVDSSQNKKIANVKVFEKGHGEILYSAVFKFDEEKEFLKPVYSVNEHFKQHSRYLGRWNGELDLGWCTHPTNCGRYLVEVNPLINWGRKDVAKSSVIRVFDSETKESFSLLLKDVLSEDQIDQFRKLKRDLWLIQLSDDSKNQRFYLKTTRVNENQSCLFALDLKTMKAGPIEDPDVFWMPVESKIYKLKRDWFCESVSLLDGKSPPQNLKRRINDTDDNSSSETFVLDLNSGSYRKKEGTRGKKSLKHRGAETTEESSQ